MVSPHGRKRRSKRKIHGELAAHSRYLAPVSDQMNPLATNLFFFRSILRSAHLLHVRGRRTKVSSQQFYSFNSTTRTRIYICACVFRSIRRKFDRLFVKIVHLETKRKVTFPFIFLLCFTFFLDNSQLNISRLYIYIYM